MHALPPRTLPALAALTLLLAACTSTLSSEELIPARVRVERRLDPIVAVEATSSPSGFLDSPRVAARELAAAVRAALAASRLFPPGDGEPTHVLRAEVLAVQESSLSLDQEASVTIRWTFSGPGTEPWSRTLTTSHTAHTYNTDELADRQRVAVAEAVRANIADALAALSASQPGPPPVQGASSTRAR